MIFCPKCSTELLPGAKFCHNCGTNVDVPIVHCVHCGADNPADAKFCYNCSKPVSVLNVSGMLVTQASRYDFEIPQRLEDQIRNHFFEELKRLAQWIAPARVDDYLRSFFNKNFAETVERRSRQLAEELNVNYLQQVTPSVIQLERQLENSVTSLVLYHIIYNCADINPVLIPQKIMHYEKVKRDGLDLKTMILDYLDFGNEREKVYFDAIEIPAERLKAAYQNYLFTAKNETPFFISDQSFLGNGKDGFAMTPFAIYWKAPLEKPQKIFYHHLARLERKKNWVEINNRFFNVNTQFNVKMLLLLEKLKNLFAD